MKWFTILKDRGSSSRTDYLPPTRGSFPEQQTKFWSDLSGVPVQHDDSKELIKEVAKESAEAS